MTALSSKPATGFRYFFCRLFVIILISLPFSVAAQYKMKGERVNESNLPSLSKVFKKYKVFTIDAPQLMRYAKASEKASFLFELELPGAAVALTFSDRAKYF